MQYLVTLRLILTPLFTVPVIRLDTLTSHTIICNIFLKTQPILDLEYMKIFIFESLLHHIKSFGQDLFNLVFIKDWFGHFTVKKTFLCSLVNKHNRDFVSKRPQTNLWYLCAIAETINRLVSQQKINWQQLSGKNSLVPASESDVLLILL